MVRWEPGVRERLQTAALDLYLRQGFERTTAAEIAAAAGVTERTFFRNFADKREVLFHGQDELRRGFIEGAAGAPEDAPPLAVVMAGLESSAGFFPDERRPWSRRRQSVIDAHPALRERELLKLAALGEDLATALRTRGVSAETAVLAAESGMTVFTVAFARWIADGEDRPMVDLQREALAALRATTAA